MDGSGNVILSEVTKTQKDKQGLTLLRELPDGEGLLLGDGDLDFDRLLLGHEVGLDLDLDLERDLSPFMEPDLDLLSEADLDLRRDTDFDLPGDADLDLLPRLLLREREYRLPWK
ncbi:hypothetical protein STEG23_027728 [Scotinomys teguina]